MTEFSGCHSLSIDLYYNDKNDDNVEEILETFLFGNQLSFPHNDNITRIELSLHWMVEDELDELTFWLHWIVILFIR